MGVDDELQIRGPDSVMMVKFWPWRLLELMYVFLRLKVVLGNI